MKKLSATLVLLLVTAIAYAAPSTGTAVISPAFLTPSANNVTLTITYKTASTTSTTQGSIAVQMNQNFSPKPSTDTSSAGFISAEISTASPGVVYPISVSDILINGYAVTLTAISMGPGDSLIIKYGYSPAAGLSGPQASGAYSFNMKEQLSLISGTSGSFTDLAYSPVIYVSKLTINKSCSTDTIAAGDTFTYYISYDNEVGAMNNITVTDSMPPGINFLSSAPPTSSSTGNIYSWNFGSTNSTGGSGITITAMAAANISDYGLTATNFASVYGNVTTNNSGMSVSNTVNVIDNKTFTPTFTPTSVGSLKETPTATAIINYSTPTPAATISSPVNLDRNYISTGRKDRAKISFKVTTAGECSIKIYNLNGELVKEFSYPSDSAGEHNEYWDGSNNDGKLVGQGIYFIVVRQPGLISTRKLVVIK